MSSAHVQSAQDYGDPRFDVLSLAAFADGPPHAIFDELRSGDPIHPGIAPDGRRVWSLTRYADVRTVSGDTARFSSRAGPSYTGNAKKMDSRPDMIMSVDAPIHDRLRHFFKLGFGPRVVRNFETWIRELSLEIVADVKRQAGTFDFIHALAAELPATVIAAILGMPREERHLMVQMANDIMAMTEGTPEGFKRSVAAQKQVVGYAMALRERKRREPGDDMVTMLIDASHDGAPMTDNEYIMFVMTTMAAGFETTHSAIAQSMRLLMQDEQAYSDFTSLDLDGVNNAIGELLRHVSPAMQMSRMTTEDVVIDGVAIPKGEEVIMWLTAANRDPARFEKPHDVDLRRGNVAVATFGGGGPHFCIGNLLARLELRVLFEEFHRHDIRLVQDGPLTRMKSMMMNGISHMPVRLRSAG